MNIDKNGLYMVYNYSQSPVSVQTRYESILIEGARNGEPVCKPLSFEEIAYINSNSNVFKIGLLQFEKEHAKELHESLRNDGWETILTDDQIKDAIIAHSSQQLKDILAIKNPMYFDRVRGILIWLINNNYDVSNKVSSLIQDRYKELCKGIINTRLEVVDRVENSQQEVIAQLEEQVRMLTEKLNKSVSDTPVAEKTSTEKGKKSKSTKSK